MLIGKIRFFSEVLKIGEKAEIMLWLIKGVELRLHNNCFIKQTQHTHTQLYQSDERLCAYKGCQGITVENIFLPSYACQ